MKFRFRIKNRPDAPAAERRETMKPLDPDQSKLIVETIYDSNSITEALGITKARRSELVKHCKEAFAAHERMTDSMSAVSKQCLHANELFYCSFVVTIMKDRKTQGDEASLQAFLKSAE